MDLDTAIDKFLERDLHCQRVYSLKKRIHELKKKGCGGCKHWMKSSCYPEKYLKQFKSTSSPICKDYIQEPYLTEMITGLESELQQLFNN